MSVWDICFDLIHDAQHRVTGPNRDFGAVTDIKTRQTLRTQNLKKHSSNTVQVLRDRERYQDADIVWVFGPNGQYSHRIDIRVDSRGSRSGEIYDLRQKSLLPKYVLPDNPDVKLEDLLESD